MSIHINHRNNSITTGSNAESAGITLTINNTGSLVVPKGTTVERPSSPVAGMFRFNINTGSLEYYNGTAWTTVFGGNVEDLTGSSNELIVDGVSVGATAANYVRITNALTGNDPVIAAAGTDTNIDLQVNSKGTGVVTINSALNVSPATTAYTLGIATVTSGISQTVSNSGDLFLKGKDVTVLVSGAGRKFAVVSEGGNDLFNVISSGGAGLTVEAGGTDTRVISSAGNLSLVATGATGRIRLGNGTNTGLVVNATTPGPQLEVITGGGTTTVYTSGSLTFNTDSTSINFSSKILSNVATPVNGTDAANKDYVDNVAAGLDWKQSVRAATTSNITLSGEITVDGVSLVSGNRVLVKNQTSAQFNGIYEVRTGTWVRATDADTSSEVTAGLAVFVEEGTINADTGWVLITNNPITLGTTELQFTQFTGAASLTIDGEDGIIATLSGSVWNIRAEVDNLTIWSSAPSGTGEQLAVFAPDAVNQYSVLIAPASAGPGGRSAVWGKVQLDSGNAVDGILQVQRGGTGLNSVPLNNILVGTGASSLAALSSLPATSELAYVLRASSTGLLEFGPISIGQLSDVVFSATPAAGDILRFDGTNWVLASANVTDRQVAVNSAATPGYLKDVLVSTTSGAIVFTSAGNTLTAEVNYDNSTLIVVSGELVVGGGLPNQVLLGTSVSTAATWSYLASLRNTTGSALFTVTGTGINTTLEASAEGSVLNVDGNQGFRINTSGSLFLNNVSYPKTVNAHSVLVTNSNNVLTPVTTGGNENRFLMYNAATSAFTFVSAGVVGGQFSFGKVALSGNFTGSSVVSAGVAGDTLTLTGGNAIRLVGSAVSTGITLEFANVNMSSVPVAFDDKSVFFDTSNSDKPEHRTFKGIFNDLSVPHNLTALGFAVQTSANEWLSRTFVASTSADRVGIEILNGNGVGGNPTVGLNVESLSAVTTFSADSTFLVAYRSTTDENTRISVNNLINVAVDKTRIYDTPNTTYVDVDEVSGKPVVYSLGQRVAMFDGSSTAASSSRFFNFNTGTSADSIRIEASGTATDLNIRLVPKGTGSVIIGDTVGDGIIQSDPGTNLVLKGGDGGGDVELVAGSAGSVIIRNGTSAKLVTFENNYVRQHSNNDNSYKDEYVIRLNVATSGASDSYEITLQTSSVMMMEGHIVGFSNTPNSMVGYKVEAVLFRLGSGAGIVDSTLHTLIAASGESMVANIVTSGNNAKLTVTSSAPASFTAFLRTTVVR